MTNVELLLLALLAMLCFFSLMTVSLLDERADEIKDSLISWTAMMDEKE